jgi:hypothetical protein
MKFTKREVFVFACIAILFLFLRLPGIHIPYHQDEYKWPLYSDTSVYAPGSVPHPPLTEFIYRVVAPNFGYENFRLVPLIFSFADLFLLFYLSLIIFKNKRSAFVAAVLFSVSFYSILASLMVDVDGAIMPFFLLILFIGYFKLKENSFNIRDKNNYKWLMALLVGGIGGFLIKVSGLLPIAAVAIDFAILNGAFDDKKRFFKYVLYALGLLVGMVLVLVVAKIIFPFFNISFALKYWEHFANSSSFLGRGWLQTFIQFSKSLMYTSPLLVLPLLLINKEIFIKLRPLFNFIFIGLFFYLFLFDFSIGALDRYFQFLIIPLCLIATSVYSRLNLNSFKNSNIIFPVLISISIFLLQFSKQYVPALYPKTEWINRIFGLKWSFLFPFTGGSGPTGFYVSFAFIALIWIISIVVVLTSFYKRSFVTSALTVLILTSLVYNGVFIEEYLYGKINGSPYDVFQDAKQFIIKNNNIKSVIVYNDIGGYEIKQTGKYTRRMYAAPQFENEYKKYFEDYKGYILFVNITRIDPNSFYTKYMMFCKLVFNKMDKNISANVYSCGNK